MEIIVNGNTYVAPKPKARAWSEIAKFDEHKSELSASEYIDKHAEIIAKFFPGLTVDDILDNCDLDDILTMYYQVFLWVTKLITSKLATIKNANGDESE